MFNRRCKIKKDRRTVGLAAARWVEGLENRMLLAAGNGLAGVYYNSADLSGSPVAARVDPTVNFVWSGSPATNVNADHFSVQWSGKLMPLYTGSYSIITNSDEGVRVSVNGKMVIDDWTPHATKIDIGTAVLTAGQLADIKVNFFDGTGAATAQLSWYSKSQHQEIIPTSQLYAAGLPVIPNPPAATVPAVPVGFVVAAVSSSQIKISWQDVSGETGYKIERSPNGTTWTQIAAPAANATSYTDSGLTANTNYSYRLRATNAKGDSGYTAVASAKTQAIVTPPPGTTVPPVPAGFTATGISSSQVQLTWQDVVGETIYKPERSADGTTWSQIAGLPADTTSYVDSRLSANTTYFYRLRDANAVGNSQFTPRVTATTLSGTTPPVTTVPAVPGGFAATGVSSSQIKISWQDVSGETGYKLERSPNGTTWTQIGTPAVDATSYTDNGLTADTSYSYRLRATNSKGDSAYTTVVTAKTQAIVTPPPANGAYQPDAIIQIHHDTTFIGDNIYNTTGADQTKVGTTDFYGTVFKIRVYNDGKNADSFIISGPAGDANWRVTYYDSFVFGWNGGKDISASVEGGGWNTGNVDPGAYREFRGEVLALAAPGGDVRNLTFTVRSTHDASKIDVVKGTVNNPVNRAVTWRRQNFGPGTTYLMSVQNQGNLPDQIDITAALGAGAGSTWNAQFFDDNFGGNDISAAVKSGAGWKTKVLQPWESQEFRVVFSYTNSKLPTVQLTAASVGKPDTKEQLTVNVGDPEPFPVSSATDVFPIGVWTQPVSSFDKWKSRGVNTLIEYQGDGATIEQWSQAARDRGMYYIRRPLANPALDKGDKNLLAWALPDEPEITTKYPPATLQSWVDSWKAADPTRPIWVNFSGGYVLHWQGNVSAAGYQPYLNTTDWESSSIYPVTGWNRPEPNPGLSAPGQAVDRLEKWTNGNPQWAVIEPSDQELSWIQKEIPGPNTGQFRAEVWDSVIHGARGIIYFPESFSPSFKFDNTSPELAAEMTKVDAKLQSIAGALNSDIDPPTRGLQVDGPLEGTWRVKDGKTYYVVLNFSDQTVTKNITLQGIGPATSAVVNGEGRNVALTNGTLSDTFAPFEVHVYQVG